MTNLFAAHEVDRDAWRDGIPVEIDGAVFRVRYAGAENMPYQRALGVAALSHSERALFQDVAANAERLAAIEPEITAAAMFGTVVIGWDNVTGRHGELLEYSRENWLDLALSCPFVLGAIRRAAEDFAGFRAKAAEEVADNLGKSLTGPESGDRACVDSQPCERQVSEFPL